MKKIKSLFVVFLLALLLVSCSETGGDNLIDVDQTFALLENTTDTAKYDEVKDFLKNTVSLSDFGKKYNITFYKHFADIYYTVLNTDDGYKLFFFGNDMKYQNTIPIAFSDYSIKAELCSIEVGANLNDIRSIDPLGSYDFLNHSWSGYPRISYHFFADGTCVSFKYDNMSVKEIIKFTI